MGGGSGIGAKQAIQSLVQGSTGAAVGGRKFHG